MSQVARRESPVSTGLAEGSEQAGATPVTSKSFNETATSGVTARSNRLESYRGPPPSPHGSAASPQGGGEPGPGMTAGQLALSGGRAAGSGQLESAYEEIRGALSTHLTDWAVTDAEVHRVHELLERLPSGDYRRTLERMDSQGLLSRYVEELGPQAREAFLAQAERKGLFHREPGQPAPHAPCNPPQGPALYFNDSELPSALRNAIHTSNRAAMLAYGEAYQSYLQRYVEQVQQARGPRELRELGRPVAPFAPSEPGVLFLHPDEARFRSGWARVQSRDTRSRAHQAVAARLAELGSGLRPGALYLKGEAELSTQVAGVGVKKGAEFTLATGGQVQQGHKGGVEKELHGLKLGAEVDDTGKVKGQGGVELGGLGVEVDSEGTLKLEVPVPGFGGAYAEVSLAEGRFGGGVDLKRQIHGSEVKVSLGMGMQGARSERAQDVTSREPDTLFGPLPELEQGVPWECLEPRRRERMLRDGWTPADWEQALHEARLLQQSASR